MTCVPVWGTRWRKKLIHFFASSWFPLCDEPEGTVVIVAPVLFFAWRNNFKGRDAVTFYFTFLLIHPLWIFMFLSRLVVWGSRSLDERISPEPNQGEEKSGTRKVSLWRDEVLVLNFLFAFSSSHTQGTLLHETNKEHTYTKEKHMRRRGIFASFTIVARKCVCTVGVWTVHETLFSTPKTNPITFQVLFYDVLGPQRRVSSSVHHTPFRFAHMMWCIYTMYTLKNNQSTLRPYLNMSLVPSRHTRISII